MFLSILMQIVLSDMKLEEIKIPNIFESSRVEYIQNTNTKSPEKVLIDNFESIDVKLIADRAIVIDFDSGAVLYEKNSEEKQSLASITKLMTAMVFLDYDLDLSTSVYMIKADEREGAFTRVYRDEQISLKDLLAASLVSSDNNATIALARSTGLAEADFIKAMNDKAEELNLENTDFADPAGLDVGNLSTAADVVKLLYYSLEYPLIAELTTTDSYYFNTLNTGRQIKAFSTDYLLNSELFNGGDYEVLGGKTGFIDEAGYCFTAKLKDKNGNSILAAVLNSETVDSRFQDMKSLVYWVFKNFNWKE
jgi:D-alanyl-D-alanine endopeptidase (penicillin-binding protein 7)